MTILDKSATARRKTIRSVDKALRVLETLAHEDEVSLSELAARLGMPKSSLYHLLATLEVAAYVRQDGRSARYSLGPAVLALAAAYQRRNADLRSLAHPVLEALAQAVRETASLGVIDGTAVTYIDQVARPEGMRVAAVVGSRAPLHCTAIGKVLLAFEPEDRLRVLLAQQPLFARTARTITDPAALAAALAQIRQADLAFDDEEYDVGIRCLAAPIRDATDRVVAGLTISGPAGRLTPERLREIEQPLRQACAEISSRLGYRPGH